MFARPGEGMSLEMVRSVLSGAFMTTLARSDAGSETFSSSANLLMGLFPHESISLRSRDVVEAGRQVRRTIGACLLELEALGKVGEDGFHEVRRELGRLNLMLAREDFQSRETARETCRVVEAQLNVALAVLADCREKVRGFAYVRVSRLAGEWMILEGRLSDFATRLEEFEGESFSGNTVYTAIDFNTLPKRVRSASVLAQWLGGMFSHVPVRMHRSGAKF